MIRLSAFSDEASSSLDGQIEALKRNGIALTELRGVDGVNVADLTDKAAVEINKKLKENGISVWSLGSPYGKVRLDDGFSEEKLFHQLDRLCRLCRIFGCDKIRVFSFYNAGGKADTVFRLLRESVKLASEYGVGLYHENEKDIYGEKCEQVLELKENVPGLKFVYDPANYLQAGQSADITLPAVFGITSYFHIKDVIAETGQLVPAGHGDGHIGDIINKVGFDTVFTIEPHLAVFDGYAQIDGHEMKNKYRYKNNGEAFDAAVGALKTLLEENGYRYENGGYVK